MMYSRQDVQDFLVSGNGDGLPSSPAAQSARYILFLIATMPV
jgi:hypothetical protein